MAPSWRAPYIRCVKADKHTALRRLLDQKLTFELRAGILSQTVLSEQLALIIEEELGAPDEALWREQLSRLYQGMDRQFDDEQSWIDRTANDELYAALESVGERGIVALEANGTTVQHGWAIAETMAAESAPNARGVVFYHLQDLERAVAGEGLTLAFGAFDSAALTALAARAPPPEGATETLTIQRRTRNAEGHGEGVLDATRIIGEEVVAALRQHGFAPIWDGSPRTRIELPPFEWRKRRQTAAPPAKPRPALVLPAPAAEPAPEPRCPDCEGRGWLPPLVPGDFSDFCWCKGGKRPRPAVAVAVEPAPRLAPAPLAPETEPPLPPGLVARLKKWLGGSD